MPKRFSVGIRKILKPLVLRRILPAGFIFHRIIRMLRERAGPMQPHRLWNRKSPGSRERKSNSLKCIPCIMNIWRKSDALWKNGEIPMWVRGARLAADFGLWTGMVLCRNLCIPEQWMNFMTMRKCTKKSQIIWILLKLIKFGIPNGFWKG